MLGELRDSPIYRLPTGQQAARLATVMAEAGDWLFKHHYGRVFPTPVYELKLSDDDTRLFLIRNKKPRFVMEIKDAATWEQHAAALRNGAEFLKKVVAYDQRRNGRTYQTGQGKTEREDL